MLSASVSPGHISRTKHLVGLPPSLDTMGAGARLLPQAALLLLVRLEDGVYLFRYSADGEDAGDTWHQTEDEAKRQAEFEFGGRLGPWVERPDLEPQRLSSFAQELLKTESIDLQAPPSVPLDPDA